VNAETKQKSLKPGSSIVKTLAQWFLGEDGASSVGRDSTPTKSDSTMSQAEWILMTLKRKPLTALDALQGCGCMRLAARINDLRADGHVIGTEMVSKNGKKFAQYYLIKERSST
jgi:hypothetical protein